MFNLNDDIMHNTILYKEFGGPKALRQIVYKYPFYIVIFLFNTHTFFMFFKKINFSFDFFIGILSVYYFLPVFWTSYHPYLMISRKSSKKKPMFTREICKHWDEIHWYKCEWNLICPKNKFCILNCNCNCIIILNPRLFYQK